MIYNKRPSLKKTNVQQMPRMSERQRNEIEQIEISKSAEPFDDEEDVKFAFFVESKYTQEFFNFLRSKGINPSQPKLAVSPDIDEILVALSDCTLDEAQEIIKCFATKFVLNATYFPDTKMQHSKMASKKRKPRKNAKRP